MTSSSFAEDMGVEGVSVTIPFKLDALRAAASGDALTQQVGAANTLRRRGAELGSDQHRCRGVSAAARIGMGKIDGRRSRVGAWCRRCRARGHRRARVEGCARDGACQARGAGAGARGRTSTSRSGAYPPETGSWDMLVNCTPLGGAARR